MGCTVWGVMKSLMWSVECNVCDVKRGVRRSINKKNVIYIHIPRATSAPPRAGIIGIYFIFYTILIYLIS